jgi:tRNA (adenine22-N1)-methyltransferase
MIKLSKRLSVIAKYIESNDKVIDIGCDHALLDIYLSKEKQLKKIIASDIVKHSIDIAKLNIDKYKANNIELRCGNGLEVLKESDDINTIIISGMGYQKIIEILSNVEQYNITKIIIQSNNYPNIIRKYIIKHSFFIEKEELVKEKSKIYTVIVFKKGIKRYSNKELEIGPIILKNKGVLYKEWLDNSIKTNLKILKKLPKKYVLSRIKFKLKVFKYKKEKKS